MGIQFLRAADVFPVQRMPNQLLNGNDNGLVHLLTQDLTRAFLYYSAFFILLVHKYPHSL